MVTLDEIKIDRMLYWVGEKEVNSGRVSEIKIDRDGLRCVINSSTLKASALYKTPDEAEVVFIDKEIKSIKKDIHKRCQHLKHLRELKINALAAVLSGLK